MPYVQKTKDRISTKYLEDEKFADLQNKVLDLTSDHADNIKNKVSTDASGEGVIALAQRVARELSIPVFKEMHVLVNNDRRVFKMDKPILKEILREVMIEQWANLKAI
jgi:hypothetical protein